MPKTADINELKNAENSKVKAYADVTFGGEMKVTNISLIENANGGMFVSMPRYKSGEPDDNGNAVYKDICYPVTKEAREKLHDIVFAEYKKAKDETRAPQNNDRSTANSVPDWIEAADEELPFPGKDEGERAIGYIPPMTREQLLSNVLQILRGLIPCMRWFMTD